MKEAPQEMLYVEKITMLPRGPITGLEVCIVLIRGYIFMEVHIRLDAWADV